MAKPAEVHLCGSIPLAGAGAVFKAVSETLGGAVRRIPDGETGGRLSWLGWQNSVFEGDPNFEAIASDGDYRAATTPEWMRQTTWFKLKEGIDAGAIEIAPFGYARHAIESYAEFEKQVAAGVVDGGARFMVAIPAPFNVLNSAIAPADRLRIEPAFEARLYRELDEIAAAIPHNKLAIQWDCAQDMQAYDGARQTYFEDSRDGLVERWLRIAAHVPGEIEMGYHLCYGSLGGKHFVEPKDMASMVEGANRICAGAGRTVEFFHMPVPVERDDDAYFSALGDLALAPETELYLGLIHDSDGAEGSRRRIEAADKFCGQYGIATECGFGRRDADTVAHLIELHATLAAERSG